MSRSGCSATSGSRLFISIRIAASCGHPWQLSSVPRGARTGRGPAPGPEVSLRMVNDCPPGPGAYRRPRQLLAALLLETVLGEPVTGDRGVALVVDAQRLVHGQQSRGGQLGRYRVERADHLGAGRLLVDQRQHVLRGEHVLRV